MLVVTFLFSLALIPFGARASTQTFVVGSESTFVNVFTRESRRNGRRIGRVRLDLREIEANCRGLDAGFEGIVRLSRRRGVSGRRVSIDCLGRPDAPAVAISGAPTAVGTFGG